jgi:hypothetical protein
MDISCCLSPHFNKMTSRNFDRLSISQSAHSCRCEQQREKESGVELSVHDKRDRKDLARMIFMAVQRLPGREDGRRLKYRCRSSVGTLIGIGTLRQCRGLDAKPLMDADVAKERG